MFDLAIELNPKYSNAYNNKVISLDNLKRSEEAIEMFDIAIQLNPQFTDAYNNKGYTLYYFERYEEALLYLTKFKNALWQQ